MIKNYIEVTIISAATIIASITISNFAATLDVFGTAVISAADICHLNFNYGLDDSQGLGQFAIGLVVKLCGDLA